MGEAKKRKHEIEALKANAKVKDKADKERVKSIFDSLDFTLTFLGDKDTRKRTGAVFTPFEIAYEMAKASTKACHDPKELASSTTLDPCVGYGNLLLVLMMVKIEVYGCDPTIVFANTYGKELNPESVKVCKENMRKFAKHYGIEDDLAKVIIENNYVVGNALEGTKGLRWVIMAIGEKLMDKYGVVATMNDGGCNVLGIINKKTLRCAA